MTDSPTPETTPTLPDQLQAEISRVVIGQDPVIRQLLMCLIAGGHALLEGYPGMGKTLLVRTLAATFSGQFRRIQFTPDLMPSDVVGQVMFNPKEGVFHTRPGPVFTNLLLADEINRSPAKTQAALLETMQEAQVTLDGKTRPLPKPFMTVATQNPIELEGTYPLPEAQLDRFLMKIMVNYPDMDAEKALVRLRTTPSALEGHAERHLDAIATPDAILALQQSAATLSIDDRVVDYAIRIVRETRSWPGIALGGSPRAAISLVRCGKAAALLANRDFVTPDDIKTAAIPVLRHRIKLTPEFEIEGHAADEVLHSVLDRIDAPRQ